MATVLVPFAELTPPAYVFPSPTTRSNPVMSTGALGSGAAAITLPAWAGAGGALLTGRRTGFGERASGGRGGGGRGGGDFSSATTICCGLGGGGSSCDTAWLTPATAPSRAWNKSAMIAAPSGRDQR